MRKSQHQEILTILDMMTSAHREIEQYLDGGRKEHASELLEECQNCAIEIGIAIEKSEGEGTKTVTCLEEYCEAVFQVHNDISIGIRILHDKLQQVKQSARDDVLTQIEILFLPYKRAMWDSMESVWQAAMRDDECVAYVMPIPYYDKNADGTFGEMHYEGGLYDMPILDWQTCDVQTMHPDIIVVHNPYDQYNQVTSIHPHFYMKNLRMWADKLIYIPYFVHQGNRVHEKYCVLPGTMYADTVVLQSEEVRWQYINNYGEELGIDEGLEKKFVALGSPKFDATGQACELPEEWKEFIYKDDKRKKVVFLNTHVNCVMKYKAENFFRKMEDIFTVFRTSEEVVLLWRPHPLMLDTIKAMNPELLERYQNLIKRYKEDKIGIYDEQDDYHLALQISDAYYGSRSSLAEVFRVAGKPVMIMNLKVNSGEKE